MFFFILCCYAFKCTYSISAIFQLLNSIFFLFFKVLKNSQNGFDLLCHVFVQRVSASTFPFSDREVVVRRPSLQLQPVDRGQRHLRRHRRQLVSGHLNLKRGGIRPAPLQIGNKTNNLALHTLILILQHLVFC